MLSLLLPLMLLGLAAVDPVGIAAMPFLLLHPRPILRSVLFLLGSFVSLLVMGFVFSSGLGAILIGYEEIYNWVVPVIELLAGIVLLFIAWFLIRKDQAPDTAVDLSGRMRRSLMVTNGRLFAFGAIIVAVQSSVDVVFVVAMIRLQQTHLTILMLLVSITTYAIAALAIQIAIVLAHSFVPGSRRKQLMSQVSSLTAKYAHSTVIVISLLFGAALSVNGIFALLGYPHF